MVISFIFQTLHQSLQDLIPIIVLLFKDNRTTASALRYCYTVGIWSYLFNMAQHINKILLLFVAVLHSLNKSLLRTDPSQRIKKLWEIFLKHSYGLQWGIQQSPKRSRHCNTLPFKGQQAPKCCFYSMLVMEMATSLARGCQVKSSIVQNSISNLFKLYIDASVHNLVMVNLVYI